MAGMGDLKQVEREQNRRLNALITKACVDAFASAVNRGNCSAFVRDVGRRLGIIIIGQQANDIYFEIQRPPWTLLGIGNQGLILKLHIRHYKVFWLSLPGKIHLAMGM
jgi:hypothetical protein